MAGEPAQGSLGGPAVLHRGRRLSLDLIAAAIKLGLRIGAVDLKVGRARIDEDHIAGEVQQIGSARKDSLGDARQGGGQEVHGAVSGVLLETRAALDRHPFGHPAGGGQLRGRLQGTLGDQSEDDALGRLGIEAATRGGRPQGLADTQPLEEPIEHEGAAEAAGIHDLDLTTADPALELGRLKEA